MYDRYSVGSQRTCRRNRDMLTIDDEFSFSFFLADSGSAREGIQSYEEVSRSQKDKGHLATILLTLLQQHERRMIFENYSNNKQAHQCDSSRNICE